MGDKTQVSKSSPEFPGEAPSELNSLNLFFGNLNKK